MLDSRGGGVIGLCIFILFLSLAMDKILMETVILEKLFEDDILPFCTRYLNILSEYPLGTLHCRKGTTSVHKTNN
jgi:hypothetical protein